MSELLRKQKDLPHLHTLALWMMLVAKNARVFFTIVDSFSIWSHKKLIACSRDGTNLQNRASIRASFDVKWFEMFLRWFDFQMFFLKIYRYWNQFFKNRIFFWWAPTGSIFSGPSLRKLLHENSLAVAIRSLISGISLVWSYIIHHLLAKTDDVPAS